MKKKQKDKREEENKRKETERDKKKLEMKTHKQEGKLWKRDAYRFAKGVTMRPFGGHEKTNKTKQEKSAGEREMEHL